MAHRHKWVDGVCKCGQPQRGPGQPSRLVDPIKRQVVVERAQWSKLQAHAVDVKSNASAIVRELIKWEIGE